MKKPDSNFFSASLKNIADETKVSISLNSYHDRVRAEQRRLHQMYRDTKDGTAITYLGKTFILNKNVFQPRPDSESLVRNMIIRKGDRVLDMCTGSGVIAVHAALEGASKVLAIDINQYAVRNARQNAERFGLGNIIEVRKSDMFNAVKPREKFDVITMNPPFTEHPLEDVISASTWDEDLHVHKEFFKHAGKHLEKKGRAYVCQANFGAVKEMKKMATKAGFKVKEIGRKTIKAKDKQRTKLEFYAFELTC
jgi:HemK-like putative methylase